MTNGQAYGKPAYYQILVQGALDQNWSEWLGNLAITPQDGGTLLAGQVTDQAALLGILGKLNDFRMVILSVEKKNC